MKKPKSNNAQIVSAAVAVITLVILICGKLKCGQSNKSQQSVIDINEIKNYNKYKDVWGDFNGDGKKELASVIESEKKTSGNYKCLIKFNDTRIKNINIEFCDHLYLVNEGDLNGDGCDDLTIEFSGRNSSVWNVAKCYTYFNSNDWQVLATFSLNSNWDILLEDRVSKIGANKIRIIHDSSLESDTIIKSF